MLTNGSTATDGVAETPGAARARQRPTATAATSATAVAATTLRVHFNSLRRRRAHRTADVSGAASAAANSATVAKRSEGRLASATWIAASTPLGTSGRSWRSGVTG